MQHWRTTSRIVHLFWICLVCCDGCPSGQRYAQLEHRHSRKPNCLPESDVMLCGIASSGNDIPLTCKTQRKMQQGDELFVLLETPDNSVSVRGTIQFFEIV